jgi:hypothetical protein
MLIAPPREITVNLPDLNNPSIKYFVWVATPLGIT